MNCGTPRHYHTPRIITAHWCSVGYGSGVCRPSSKRSKPWRNYVFKFRRRLTTLSILSLIDHCKSNCRQCRAGALIGFGTNLLAIKSLFRPLRPRWYSLGWQGVIPRNKEKLASNISRVVGTDLLARDYLLEQLQNETLQKSVHRFVAAQIDRLLSTSLAYGFAQLPPNWRGEGLENATRRVLDWSADWSESESGLELKQWLLDELEARLGTLQVGQVLSAEQLDEFISTVSGVLAKRETREHLTRSLQERLEDYLGSDTPIEKILPGGIARYITRPFAARNPGNTGAYSPLAEGS